jgi:hypothetical protein
MKTKDTNAIEKLIPSVINAFVALVLSIPFYLLLGFTTKYKLILILIFWLYNILFLLFNKNRDLGMIIMETYWKEGYPIKNQLLYSVLYTLSFATIVIWVFFPFDLLIANLLLLQLPMVITKKTTLHGYLSGDMVTVKRI